MRATIARLPWVVLLAASAATAASTPRASSPDHASATSRGLLYGRVTMASGAVFEVACVGAMKRVVDRLSNSAKVGTLARGCRARAHAAANRVFGVKLPSQPIRRRRPGRFIALRRHPTDRRGRTTRHGHHEGGVTYLVQDGSERHRLRRRGLGRQGRWSSACADAHRGHRLPRHAADRAAPAASTERSAAAPASPPAPCSGTCTRA